MRYTPIHLLFLSTIIFLLVVNSVLGSVYIYLPGEDIIAASPPDVEFFESGQPNIVTSIGPNRTSFKVEIKASTTPYELTTNGNYTGGPAPWLFIPGTYLDTAIWFPNRLGRDGVIMINGTINVDTVDAASIIQQITWPTQPIASATLDIGYYASTVTSGFAFALLYIGYRIIPVGGGAPVDSGSTSIAIGSWNTVSFPINVAALTPGADYFLLIDVIARVIIFFGGIAYVEFNLDYSILTVTPLRPSFSGAFGHANTSIRSYNVSLYIVSVSANGNANVSIWLRNHTASVDSTKIIIINSIVVSDSTNKISIAPVPPGYLALDLLIDTTIDPTASITIDLIMRVEVEDNVYVEYPMIIFIYDPPLSSNNVNYIMLENPVYLAVFNKDVDIQFIFNATSS